MAKAPTQVTSRSTKVNVSYERRELRDRKADYQKVVDCVAGQSVIKKKGDKYLPRPNASDESDENQARYDAYKERAVFYNVTGRTLSGLVGEVFARDPVEELPPGLDVVSEDADGAGLTLTQLAKKGCRHTLSLGRAGLLADYPQTEGGVTRAEVAEVRPTLTMYDALSIINWRTHKVGNETQLTLVVLVEMYDKEDDGFETKQEKQYRVLRLVGGVYTVQLYRDGSPYGDTLVPTDHTGATFEYIPFTFIGSENNDSEVDHAPLLDLAEINIGHYHNSADYEESAFITGQPTLTLAGLTEEWVNNVLKGEVRIGSRGAIPLPEGGKAAMFQAAANTMPFEAMEHKERQMVALGAKLVEQKQVQRTATEAGIEHNTETSTLSNVAKNVSAAIKFGLEVCARFVGLSDSVEIVYELNTDFTLARMTAQERQQLIAEWQQGAITFSEMRAAMRKSGVATLDDEEAREEIKDEVDMMGHNGGPGLDDEDDEGGTGDEDDEDDPNAGTGDE